jgi:tripartite-type tricarboxylate transporter receptor subunit TctC
MPNNLTRKEIKMQARNLLLLFSAVVLVLGGLNPVVYAEGLYPNRTIQITIPHTPGGGNDALVRLLADELTKIWKVPVNVFNKPGGGGAVAASDVAHAGKDGYTILGMLESTLVAMSVAKPDGPVNLFRDFDPLASHYSYAPNVLVTYNNSPYKSLEDVVNYAKAKPGDLICGTSSIGADITLEAMLFNRSAKIDITPMNFEGAAEVTRNVLGKHIPLGMVGFIPARPHIAAGTLRVLASDSKSSMLQAPTFAEKGYPEVNVISSIVFAGPKGLPPAVIKTWADTVSKIGKDPDFIARVKKIGSDVTFYVGAENEKYLRNEVKNFSRFTPEELGWKK